MITQEEQEELLQAPVYWHEGIGWVADVGREHFLVCCADWEKIMVMGSLFSRN